MTNTITIGVPVGLYVEHSNSEIGGLLLSNLNKFMNGKYELPEQDGDKRVNVVIRIDRGVIDIIKENVNKENTTIIDFTYNLLRGSLDV